MSLEDGVHGDTADAFLSEAERERASKYLDPRHRRRFVVGRVRLRSVLGALTGLDPQAIVFEENEFGKPRLLHEPSLHFNFSHSSELAVLATSQTLHLGVDVEEVSSLGYLELARQSFCAGEYETLEGLPKEEQLQAFYQTWTLKEAIVKAIGVGLSIPLDQFEVSIRTSPPRLIACPVEWPTPEEWGLHFMTPAAGYLCAIAIPGGAHGVEFIQRTG